MSFDFDLIVIGAGSGGIACGVAASKLGAKVLIIDKASVGGTCVNVGCVPKKIMWYASYLEDTFKKASGFGFEQKFPHLDWDVLIDKREKYIQRIHDSYQKTFTNQNITYLEGAAALKTAHEVSVDEKIYTGAHILLATGGEAIIPRLPGAHHGITSDGFFELKHAPNHVAVIGAGYIAVEMAGILQGLGSRTHQCIRKQQMLRTFDSFVSDKAQNFLVHQGVDVIPDFTPMMVEKQPNGQLRLLSNNEQHIQDLDCILWAIGRKPNTEALGLDKVGIQCDENGLIPTSHDHSTCVDNIYAVGDITHHKQLTPVAIRAGRRLAARLFGGGGQLPLDGDLVPTVLFSHPPIGTIGLSEKEAKEKFGENQIKVYQSEFKPMYEAFMDHPVPFGIKLITQGDDEKVIGCHIAGNHADEMLQGFAVAIQMGATKIDFDNTIAIHPTSSEELVLMKGSS